jgi:hypothetical protein
MQEGGKKSDSLEGYIDCAAQGIFQAYIENQYSCATMLIDIAGTRVLTRLL